MVQKRLQMINEIIHNIKTIKCNAWEKFYLEKLLQIRIAQNNLGKYRRIYKALIVAFFNHAGYFGIFIIFYCEWI